LDGLPKDQPKLNFKRNHQHPARAIGLNEEDPLMIRKLEELTPKEILAFAISIETANANIFRNFSEMFEERDKEISKLFEAMSLEEAQHEEFLTQKFNQFFHGRLPDISRIHIEDTVETFQLDEANTRGLEKLEAKLILELALEAEKRAKDFYQKVAKSTKDKVMAGLFQELAAMEKNHSHWIEEKLKAC
jgi:rubrerythrin